MKTDFFVARTPLLPLDVLERWSADLEVPASGDVTEEMVLADRLLLRRRLHELWLRPDLSEALYVSSPTLHGELTNWDLDGDEETSRRIETSLARYLHRACHRATPFGLFAGSSLGQWEDDADQARFRLAPVPELRRHTRLDMETLDRLLSKVADQGPTREAFDLYPNSSLYGAAGRLRYAEGRLDETGRSYHLVAVSPNPFLGVVLERARHGARLAELAAAVVEADEDGEVTVEQARGFLDDLVARRILVLHLGPMVTGEGPLEDAVATLRCHEATQGLAGDLERCQSRLASLDTVGLGNPVEEYRALGDLLSSSLGSSVEESRLVQVDAIKPVCTLTLSGAIRREVFAGIELLSRIRRPRVDEDALGQFRQEFARRYGDRLRVPLTEVLDEEVGIGFQRSTTPLAEGSPLLVDLPLGGRAPDEASWTGRDAYLARRVAEDSVRESGCLRLNGTDLEQLSSDAGTLPDAFHVLASIAARSEEDISQGRYRLFLKGVGGPSGARLLGRFCHLDPRLEQAVRGHLADEERQRPDALFAEVVHLPQGRTGNILARPSLREHEIVFLGSSSLPRERQIEVGDLDVSIIGDRVVLTSRRHGKEVIPRLTAAHNYMARSLGTYRFLCSLQAQGVIGGIGWNWGPLESFSFLPRVEKGRFVLARARWRVGADELQKLRSLEGARRLRWVREWRERRGVPRRCLWIDGDNELLVDFEVVLSLEGFVDALSRRNAIILAEPMPDLADLWATGPEGRFFHELVVPVTRSHEPVQRSTSSPPAAETTVPDRFFPGGEWFYVKLFTGTATADDVLRELVAPLAHEATSKGWIDSWFFLRYSESGWHLRVRFHGEPEALNRELGPILARRLKPWQRAGAIWKVQLDTYDRETHRYGGPEAIELAEKIFCADSEAVVSLLHFVSGDRGADLRWRLAVRGLTQLLDDLGLTLREKIAVTRQMREGFTEEMAADRDLKRQIGRRHRRERASLEELVAATEQRPGPWAPALEIFDRRSRRIAPWTRQLHRLAAEGQLNQKVFRLAPSFLHMHVNRIIRSEARVHELVLYEFLYRTYQAQYHRNLDECEGRQ